MEPTNTANPPKMWYPGDARVEPFMVPVNDELHRHNFPRDVRVSVYNRAYEAVEAAINKYASTREEIEAPLRAEIERLREALGRVVDHAEDWHEHYCELWGERRKEQQDAILGDILNARAALAPSAPGERTVKDSLTVGEERGPEVGE